MSRVLFCSGKVYYDLVAGREARKADNVAIVRTEMMYPFAQTQVEAILKKYPANAEVYWVQEEPRNMGPWRFMLECCSHCCHRSERFTTPGVRKALAPRPVRQSVMSRSRRIWSVMLLRRVRSLASRNA